MKLRTLRIHGFKSFADRTTIEFREGVTAIIGSNGCGKSNIADAVRWVLGEQRASAMRGARMEEVIFQGTARRRPVHFAEVMLEFENDRGRVAIPQTEIEVARKVFREGGSEYSLNRNACRLRDIHGLLRDTGLGSNAYAIIEAGMIDTLLSDRAEERRALFEEAAGIGKYKDSRQAALRRLEAAQADLQRLEDVLSEVESKVRTLARQRKRAERRRELEERKLALELAIAASELAELGAALHAAEGRHEELGREIAAAAAERSTGELQQERLRVEAAALAGRRREVAERLERVRTELNDGERERLVAEERRNHAEARLAQLVRERGESEARGRELAARAEEQGRVEKLATEKLASLQEQLEDLLERTGTARGILAAERGAAESGAARLREATRQLAEAEGELIANQRARDDSLVRTGAAREREAELREDLAQLSEQTELWSLQSADAAARLAAARSAAEQLAADVERLRRDESAAHQSLRSAEDLSTRLAAQLEAREALERSYEGFAPAVAALMALDSRFGDGVLGPLADFVVADPEVAPVLAATEDVLGPLLQAVVVEDLQTAREIRRWFREEWRGGGSLWLLPLDALGAGPRDGGRWVEVLTAGLSVSPDDPLLRHHADAVRVGADGVIVDARGVVRLLEREKGEGILERREALKRLRAEAEAAAAELAARRTRRTTLRVELEATEDRQREAERMVRAAEGEVRRAEMDEAGFSERRTRLMRELEAVAAEVERLEGRTAEAEERAQELTVRAQVLRRELEGLQAEEGRIRAHLLELESRWEEAREIEGEHRVLVARAEAEVREARERLRGAESGSAAALLRAAGLEREAVELRESMDRLGDLRTRTDAEIQRLLEQRDREAAELALAEARLAELDSELAALGDGTRGARRRESVAAEERHRAELEIADLRSRADRVRERLELEWGRPFETLVASVQDVPEGEIGAWRAELAGIRRELDTLGPVNMLAVEEHAEEERRLLFLSGQRDDLVRAREDLVSAIRQINRTAREVYVRTFETVRDHFRRTFQSLFQGGECDVTLADPDDPLESAVEIQASPKGKKTQRIHLLSGGERTLTALALLFALYLVKPSPFCVLDEVDAPLDESNVGRFLQLLHDFKRDTQFIVITHNPRTMEAADWVYGVTMEEPGVSSLVSVELLGSFGFGDRVA